MADHTKHLRVRDSRDRLIDLLRIGETSPIRDLPVQVDRLMTPLNLSAKIPIDETQPDCTYQLWHRTDDVPIQRSAGEATVPAEEPGTDATILLESPVVTEDQDYRIRAVKQGSGRWAYLHHRAEIKTGLNPSLHAWIRSGALLDPSVDSPGLTDPRVVAHGSEVEVEIASSQEGVDYRLVVLDGDDQIVISQEDVRGTLGSIVVRTRPVSDDIAIRVAGTRTFDPSEELDPQTVLLDVVLPLRVRANAALTVTLTPGAIIDHHSDASVAIENSEPGVSYQVYARTLPDRDFVYAPGEGVVSIATEAGRVVHIIEPAISAVGADLARFTALGDALTGDGTALSMSLGALVEDSMVVLRARKQHLDRAGNPRDSDTVLDDSPIILVRPDPTRSLALMVIVDGASTTGAVQLTGGQPGVYYSLRPAPSGEDIASPGYFHKPDFDDPDQNKGIGQLAIGIDGAVARASATRLADLDIPGVGTAALGKSLIVGRRRISRSLTAATRARTAPLPPIVVTTALDVGATLHAHAVKAMTGLSAAVTGSVTLTAPPVITVDDTTADGVRTVNLLVAASQIGDSYQVTRDGAALGAARAGDGGTLSFPVTPPGQETVFDMVITRPGDPGIALVRVVRVVVAGEAPVV